MRKTIYNKFDKRAITALPVLKFPGRIIVIMSEGETEKAVDYLLSSDILGVDTETRPSFHRGEMHKVALLQVSTRNTCFLFRLNHTGITPAIKRLLEDTTVKKIGLSWHDDILMLRKRQEFTPGLFIDLQDIVGSIGIEDRSLQKLYANVFGQKISKRQRLTNWEIDVLNDKQKQYAATDAWSCINLYEEIERLRKTGDYDLVVSEEGREISEEGRVKSEESDGGDAVDSVDAVLLVSWRKTKRYLLFNDDMKLVGWTNIETGEVRSPYPELNPKECRMYAFAGIHALSPRLLKMMDEFPDRFGIIDFYLKACATHNIKGYVKDDLKLMDIGKLDTLAQAEEFLEELRVTN